MVKVVLVRRLAPIDSGTMTRQTLRVLVTGATGFIGSAVVGALLAEGHHPVALVREPASRPTRVHAAGRPTADVTAADITYAVGDMLSPPTYAPLVAEVDAVVHAAQLSVRGRLTSRRAERLFHADAVMTEALADACVRHGRRLLYTGGCFDWGDHGEEWIDEQTPLNPSALGVGHARQARYLDMRYSKDGLDLVRLSPGFVYGPGGLFASAFVQQARRGRLRCLGAGRNWWSCVHVDDLGTAYTCALTKATSGAAFAVVDDEPLRLRELTDLTTDALDLPRVGKLPAPAARLVLGRTMASSLLSSFRIDGHRVRTELGWVPRRPRFRDAVSDVVAGIM